MSYRGLLNQPLTILRRSATSEDDYGNEVAGTTSSVVTEGYVEQTDAEEITVDRETYRTDWRVFLPAGVAIDGSDRIVHGARTLEVIGSPHEVWNPRSRVTHHTEARPRLLGNEERPRSGA